MGERKVVQISGLYPHASGRVGRHCGIPICRDGGRWSKASRQDGKDGESSIKSRLLPWRLERGKRLMLGFGGWFEGRWANRLPWFHQAGMLPEGVAVLSGDVLFLRRVEVTCWAGHRLLQGLEISESVRSSNCTLGTEMLGQIGGAARAVILRHDLLIFLNWVRL